MKLRTYLPSMLLVSLAMSATAGVACKRAKPPVLDGDNVVLARVADIPVSRYDVEQTLMTTLGPQVAGAATDKLRKTVLDSLVETRALAKEAEAELSPVERLAVDKQVAAYREQLLVKRYLVKHSPPESVSDTMIEDYYKAHPDRFGGKAVRTYEMVGSERSLTPKERDDLLAKLKDPDKQKDWKEWSQSLKAGGAPIMFRDGDVGDAEKVLHPKLVELMSSLKPNMASSVVFVQGRAYVVRVTGEQQRPPRPLEEVRDDIRTMLAPVQVKEAVKKAAGDVLKKTRVVYQ